MKELIATKDGKYYVLEALKNAKQFLKDAQVLIENGSYAHGAVMAVLAIEEVAKARIAIRYIGWNGALEVDSKTYREEIQSHFNKLSSAAAFFMSDAVVSRLMSQGECSWQELYQRLKKLQKNEKETELIDDLEIEGKLYACLTFLKEKWFYVDVEEGRVTSPLTWTKKDSEQVVLMAEKILARYESRIMDELKDVP